jgi:hypothetical protein
MAEEVKPIAKKLPELLKSAKAGLAKIASGVKSAAPRAAGLAKAAVTSKVGKIALGAIAIGAGVGLGSYFALSGLAAGQAYGQYATEEGQLGQPPPAPPVTPWTPQLGGGLLAPPPPPGARGYGYSYGQRLAAFFTSPFVLFILLLFVLAIIGIYFWKKSK